MADDAPKLQEQEVVIKDDRPKGIAPLLEGPHDQN